DVADLVGADQLAHAAHAVTAGVVVPGDERHRTPALLSHVVRQRDGQMVVVRVDAEEIPVALLGEIRRGGYGEDERQLVVLRDRRGERGNDADADLLLRSRAASESEDQYEKAKSTEHAN